MKTSLASILYITVVLKDGGIIDIEHTDLLLKDNKFYYKSDDGDLVIPLTDFMTPTQ